MTGVRSRDLLGSLAAEPLPMPGDWIYDAACASAASRVGHDAWFPTTPGMLRDAKAICNACPVITACAAYAIPLPLYGIWGSLTEGEREALRRRRVE